MASEVLPRQGSIRLKADWAQEDKHEPCIAARNEEAVAVDEQEVRSQAGEISAHDNSLPAEVRDDSLAPDTDEQQKHEMNDFARKEEVTTRKSVDGGKNIGRNNLLDQRDDRDERDNSVGNESDISGYTRFMNTASLSEDELDKCVTNLSGRANKKFFMKQYDVALDGYDRTLSLISQRVEHAAVYRELIADIMVLKGKIFLSTDRFTEALDEYCVALQLFQRHRKGIMKESIEAYVRSPSSTILPESTDQMNKKISLALVSVGDAELKMEHYDIAADIYDSCYFFLRYLWNRKLKKGQAIESENMWLKDKIIAPVLHKVKTAHTLRGDEKAATQAEAESQKLRKIENNYYESRVGEFNKDTSTAETNNYAIENEEAFNADAAIDSILDIVGEHRPDEGSSLAILNASPGVEEIFGERVDLSEDYIDKYDHEQILLSATVGTEDAMSFDGTTASVPRQIAYESHRPRDRKKLGHVSQEMEYGTSCVVCVKCKEPLAESAVQKDIMDNDQVTAGSIQNGVRSSRFFCRLFD